MGGGGGSVDSTTPFERVISGMMTGDVDGGWARYNETKTRVGEGGDRRPRNYTRPPDIIFPLSATVGLIMFIFH